MNLEEITFKFLTILLGSIFTTTWTIFYFIGWIMERFEKVKRL